MKIYSEEDREKEENDELDNFEDDEEAEVVYDFPSAEPSTEIFAHERRIERMRQREMSR